jgi:NAD(P)-dependent dehydrogenase (short-subunit alcohol dehydrogenase family)
MGRLDGKVAIITGAGGGGIMRVVSKFFAREGAKLIIADWMTAGGEETAKMIKETGGEVTFIKTDVSKAKDVKKVVKTAVETYGKLDILVSGAAVDLPEQVSTVDCPEETFDRTYAINLKGTWLGMKYAIPEMIRAGGGSIVNIASIAAHVAFPTIPAYSASKGGVISLSKVAAIEFAPKGVRVNCISPGPIKTPMILGQWGEEGVQRMASLLPRGQLGEMEDVANAALFLASDESANVIGHTLITDGGMKASSHVTK